MKHKTVVKISQCHPLSKTNINYMSLFWIWKTERENQSMYLNRYVYKVSLDKALTIYHLLDSFKYLKHLIGMFCDWISNENCRFYFPPEKKTDDDKGKVHVDKTNQCFYRTILSTTYKTKIFFQFSY